MSRIKSFLTGSKFVGDYNCNLNTMHGFGRYTFPDDSEYSGFFRYGRFHGYGTMLVTQPVPMIYKGHFEFGKLKKLEHVEFGDGLIVKGAFKEDNQMEFSKWKYCTAKDRRYQNELAKGMEAVGPGTHLTNRPTVRRLSTKDYDVEEGVYSPGTGFVSKRPEPFNKFRFVGCNKEKQWILKHCRRGSAAEKSMVVNFPNARTRHQIIESNVKAMKSLGDPQFECSCNMQLLQNNYFRDLCTLLQKTGYESVESLQQSVSGSPDDGPGTASEDASSGPSKMDISDSITPSASSLTDNSMQLNFTDDFQKMRQVESVLMKSNMSFKRDPDLFLVPSHLSHTMYGLEKEISNLQP